MGEGVQSDLFAGMPELRESRYRDGDRVADTTDVQEGEIGLLFE
jgi:hypothetical protein